MAKIVVERAGKVEAEIQLVGGLYSIGRDPENDVVLLSPRVSRRHARIEAIGGRYRIVDQESGNGLFYKGNKVPDMMLSPGALIDIGDYTLRLELGPEDDDDASPVPKLVVIGGGEQTVHHLDPVETTIGRSSACDVPLPSPLASSSHCKVVKRGSVYALIDLGSENGTYVDGARVENVVLKQGSQIRIGELTLYFASDGVVPEAGSVELIQPVQSARATAAAPQAARPPRPLGRAPAVSQGPRLPARPESPARAAGMPKIVLIGIGTVVFMLVLAGLLALRAPDASTEQEFQEVFQASLTAEENERIERYVTDATEYEQAGNFQRALEQYQKILVLDQTHHVALAESAQLEEKIERETTEKEARERAELERISEVGTLLERADELSGQRRYAQAREVLEQAAALAPDSDLLRSKQAATYVAEGNAVAGRDAGQARAAYRKALEIDSANQSARRGIARIDAVRRTAAQERERIDELNDKGMAELQREEFGAAQATFSQVLEVDPSDERALEFREQARQLLDDQVQPIYEDGVSLYEAGELSAAMARFHRVQELHPEHPDTRAFLTTAMDRVRGEAVDLYKRGYVFEGLGRLEEALRLYDEALALLPDPREEYHQKSAERAQAIRRKLP